MKTRSHLHLIAFCLATYLVTGGPLTARAAEQEIPLRPGDRVRVTLRGESPDDASASPVVGRISGMDSSALRLVAGSSDDRAVPRDAIVRLERSIRPSRKTRGALIGLGVGFATIFTLGTIVSEGDCFRGDDCLAGMILGSAILALPAAAVGALVAPGEEWVDVPLHPGSGPITRATAGHNGFELRVIPMVGDRKGLALIGSF